MARKTFNHTRLYGADGTFQRWISPLELAEIAHKVETAYEMRGDLQRVVGVQLVGRKAAGPGNRSDDCSLTHHDAEANVGITKGEIGEAPIGGIIARAQNRIECWPAEHDRKAVLVVPRDPRRKARGKRNHDGAMQAQSGYDGRSARPSRAFVDHLQPVFAGD